MLRSAIRRVSSTDWDWAGEGVEMITACNSPEYIEGELGMLITVTTLLMSITISMFSFYTFEELKEYDELNTYYTYSIASTLNVIVFGATLMNSVCFILSWIIYISWRTIRPSPSNRQISEMFFSEFSALYTALYVFSFVGFTALAIALHQIIVVKTGSEHDAQVAIYYSGLVGAIFVSILAMITIRKWLAVHAKNHKLKEMLNSTAQDASTKVSASIGNLSRGPSFSDRAGALVCGEIHGNNMTNFFQTGERNSMVYPSDSATE